MLYVLAFAGLSFVGLAVLAICACLVAGRASRAEERRSLRGAPEALAPARPVAVRHKPASG